MKLFCLTHAGGNAEFFNQLKNFLYPNLEVVALEYAGHGKRHKEPFYMSFKELSTDMFCLLSNQITNDEDYAIMGYSMGAIAAVELLKEIMYSCKIKTPKHVFLAAHEPYTKKELRNYDNGEMDELVKQRTIQFGGVSEKLIHNKSFWRIYLPMYKADYALIGKYNFEKLNLKTSIPATVFYSETDTPFVTISGWKDYFIGYCNFVKFMGNHFFMNDHCEEIANEIRNRLVE